MFKLGAVAVSIVVLILALGVFAAGQHAAKASTTPAPTPGAVFMDKSALGKLVYQVPAPTPIAVLWVDSAGNLGLRGVEAIVPGKPDPKNKISDACRKSSTVNGEGTLTVCITPEVGKILAKNLGGFLGGTP